MSDFVKSTFSSMTVAQDGPDVVIIKNGQRICELPWDAALMLADAIRIQARRIETRTKAEQVINDQAFGMRLGLPFGLTSDPKMIHQAGIEAAHDTRLRKQIPHVPMSIRSREALGTPSLIKHRRKDNGK